MSDEMTDHLIDWFRRPIESVSNDERESALQILGQLRAHTTDMKPLVEFAKAHPYIAAEIRMAAYKKGISFIENEIAKYKQIKAERALTPEERQYSQTLLQLLDSTTGLIIPKQ
jgi:hypothetical protein